MYDPDYIYSYKKAWTHIAYYIPYVARICECYLIIQMCIWGGVTNTPPYTLKLSSPHYLSCACVATVVSRRDKTRETIQCSKSSPELVSGLGIAMTSHWPIDGRAWSLDVWFNLVNWKFYRSEPYIYGLRWFWLLTLGSNWSNYCGSCGVIIQTILDPTVCCFYDELYKGPDLMCQKIK
jgi:hypothetical protein